MKIQLLRHATCLITVKGKKIILDPMLSPLGALEAIPQVPNPSKNPLVDLPENVNLNDLMAGLDGILVSHTHRDHFDAAAMKLLPKDKSLFCQPQDANRIREEGFLAVHPVMKSLSWGDFTIHRTGGQHGTGEIAEKMGPVSGYVLTSSGEPTLYITGDTVGCPEVRETLQKFQPDVILCFAGAAQFHEGDPITMTLSDIVDLIRNAPQGKIIAVHMEAWNHCRLSRKELETFLKEKSLGGAQVFVPKDGESIIIN